MDSDRLTTSPFGWAVPRTGYRPSQVRDEVRVMGDWARQAWQAYFPAQDGYQVEVCSPAGRGHGVQLRVERGDFRAVAAIENGRAPSKRAPVGRLQVRMFGRAQSAAVSRTQTRAGALSFGGRQIGGAVGLLVAAVLPVPIPAGLVLLGVMFWVVLALAATIVGATIGAYLGERVAEAAKVRALRDATGDAHLQHDLKRWQAVSRKLAGKRAALVSGGLAGQPFRSARR